MRRHLETELAARYRLAADDIQAGVDHAFYRPEPGRFVTMVEGTSDGRWRIDPTLDSSLFGLWYFRMFASLARPEDVDG